jgi:hypothetical protein
MIANASANGAEYESQGQAPNNVRRVAPGLTTQNSREALKERNNWHRYCAPLALGSDSLCKASPSPTAYIVLK